MVYRPILLNIPLFFVHGTIFITQLNASICALPIDVRVNGKMWFVEFAERLFKRRLRRDDISSATLRLPSMRLR